MTMSPSVVLMTAISSAEFVAAGAAVGGETGWLVDESAKAFPEAVSRASDTPNRLDKNNDFILCGRIFHETASKSRAISINAERCSASHPFAGPDKFRRVSGNKCGVL